MKNLPVKKFTFRCFRKLFLKLGLPIFAVVACKSQSGKTIKSASHSLSFLREANSKLKSSFDSALECSSKTIGTEQSFSAFLLLRQLSGTSASENTGFSVALDGEWISETLSLSLLDPFGSSIYTWKVPQVPSSETNEINQIQFPDNFKESWKENIRSLKQNLNNLGAVNIRKIMCGFWAEKPAEFYFDGNNFDGEMELANGSISFSGNYNSLDDLKISQVNKVAQTAFVKFHKFFSYPIGKVTLLRDVKPIELEFSSKDQLIKLSFSEFQ